MFEYLIEEFHPRLILETHRSYIVQAYQAVHIATVSRIYEDDVGFLVPAAGIAVEPAGKILGVFHKIAFLAV